MGVEKEVLRPGTGPKPVPGQNVTVHCTGYGYPLSLSLPLPFFFPFLSLMFLLLLFFQGKMVISLKNFGGKDCTTFLFFLKF